MPSPFIGGRIPQDLHDTLQKHIAESGEKLSQVLQQALSQYLNYTPSTENRTGLEKRVEILESSFRELSEAFAQIQEKPASKVGTEEEKSPIPTEQLSFLENKTDNSADNSSDIEKTEEPKEAAIPTDNQIDINQDNRVLTQLETISPEEMARRSGLTIGTVRTYMGNRKTVTSNGFLYSPVKSKKKGESVWSVEPVNN